MAKTQGERSEATIGELVAAAGALFRAHGYAATSIEDIVERAGVTRGALYHHFAAKQDVFRAVVEEAEQQLVASLAQAVGAGRDAWERLCAGCRAFLEACLDPGFQRVVLLDAPAVLGWAAWREVESRYGLGLVRQGIEAAMAEGHLTARSAETLAHLLLAALNEGALLIAGADDPQRKLGEVREEIDALLASMRRNTTRRRPARRARARKR
jgi:AcrR family transcriptional regulator